jgi:hypothetical protein
VERYAAVDVHYPPDGTLVAEMAGPYRLPDALRRVDALARNAVA